MRSTSRQSGYSLMEALVVIALIAAIILISVPSFIRMMHAYRLKTAASEIAVHFRFARYNSIKQKRAYQVVIRKEDAGTSPNTYAVQFFNGTSFETPKNYDFGLPLGVKILASSISQPIVFDTYGRVTPTGTAKVVRLENTNQEQYTVTVSDIGGVEVKRQ